MGSVIVPYNTVEIPPNNGTWYLCSQAPTKYVSKYQYFNYFILFYFILFFFQNFLNIFIG
jgi:hypothetical protein